MSIFDSQEKPFEFIKSAPSIVGSTKHFNQITVGAGESSIIQLDSEAAKFGGRTLSEAKAYIKTDGTFSFKNAAGTVIFDNTGIKADGILSGLITAAMTSIASINPVDGEINANKVGTLQIDTNAVTEAKILNSAVTSAKLSVAAINPVDGNLNSSTVGSAQLVAGAVTPTKTTSYNFQISAGTFTNNSPTAGKIAWTGVKVVYNGTEYSITNGSCLATDKHIYWQLAGPTAFAASANLPALGNDDFLVVFNNGGTAVFVWNSTVINGNRITSGSIIATNLAANTLTANEIAAGAITADEIAAGAVTANKLTTYNFLVSAGTFTNNSPSAGYVAWAGAKIVYNGTERTITDGNSNKKHIYWQLASPTVFAGSDTLPALGNDDFLVSHNDAGTNMFVWNSTTINGNRITAGSITSTNMAADSITANEINVATLAAISADMGSITAGTVTGAIIQTAAAGYRIKLNYSTGKLEFLNNDTVLGSLYVDAGYDLNIEATDDIGFFCGGDEVLNITSSGLTPHSDKTKNLGTTDKEFAQVCSQNYKTGSSTGGTVTLYVAHESGGAADHKIEAVNGLIIH